MRYSFLILLLPVLFFSCNRTKETAKEAINKTGEIAGKASSEFMHGVSEGIDETFQCTIDIDSNLVNKGLRTGKYKITGDSTLTVYIIFDNDFKSDVHIKVFDVKGQEYGRTSLMVEGKKGEAKYYDFAFAKPIVIQSKSRFTLE